MKKIFLTIIIILFLPIFAKGATADVLIDTLNSPLNALEATVKFPKNFKIEGIQYGKSVLTVWINQPKLDSSKNEVALSGIIPGGFVGKGILFTIFGEFNEKDLSKITFQSVKALKNDGAGTEMKVTMSTISSSVAKDTLPPENFTPTISSSDAVDGRYFASFSTLDKGTGIDHYEIAKTWIFNPSKNDWVKSQTPEILNGFDSYKKIFIKAVDGAGNEKVVAVQGPYRSKVFAGFVIFVLLFLLFVRRNYFEQEH